MTGFEFAGLVGWAAVGAAAAYTIASYALTYALNSVFAKKPKQPGSASEAQDRLITVRQAAAVGRVVFGRIRTGGTYALIHSTTYQQNNYAVTTIDYTIPQNNQAIPLYPNAIVVETISVVRKNFDPNTESYGSETVIVDGNVVVIRNADPASLNFVPTTSPNPGPNEYYFDTVNQRYTFSTADEGQSVQITYKYIASATVSKYLHLVIALACHEVAEISDIYFDDELVPLQGDGYAAQPSRFYGGWVYVSKHLGTPDQTADESLMFYAPDVWTPAHRGQGHAYIYVRLLRDLDKFPNGLPNITAIVKGYKPYDPRTGLSVWTDNWALCMSAYLTDPVFGLAHDYDLEIDEPLLIAAANISDEQVAKADGSTEARYTCNGTFLTSDPPVEILGRMKVAGSGQLVRVGGKWRLYAGAYITPSVTLTQEHLRGGVKVQPRLSGRDLFNGVKGKYVSEQNSWQPDDFPAVTNDTYLAEDNGEPKWLDMDLRYTTSSATAQRLGKIELEKVRQQITVVMPCKLSAYTLEPPRNVMLTLPQFGWTSKVFEISQLDLVADVNDQGAPYVGVDVTLRETSSTVWDWNSGEETQSDPAPDTNLPNPFAMAPPGIPTVREEFYESAGSVLVRLVVDWAPSPDGQAEFYDVEWKLVDPDVTQWQSHPGLTSTHDVIENVSTGSYDVRVRARSRFSKSTWSQARVEVIGLSAPLATPVIKGLQKTGGLAILTMEVHPDLRVRSANGHWFIRHTEDPSSPVWEESFSIGDERGYSGVNTVIVLPLKAGSYLVKAEWQGQFSEGYADKQTEQASVLTYSPAHVPVQEDPTFPGTHLNTVVSGGVLKLDAAGLIDDVADWDADITSLDALGGINLDGTYTFSTGMNFGAVKSVRLIGHIAGITVNEFDLIDDRGAPIDDWLDFDGTAGGGSADAWLEMRRTNDDPTGTPTWGPWDRLDHSEVACWGVEFRLRITTNDPAYNMNIDALSVTADEL